MWWSQARTGRLARPSRAIVSPNEPGAAFGFRLANFQPQVLGVSIFLALCRRMWSRFRFGACCVGLSFVRGAKLSLQAPRAGTWVERFTARMHVACRDGSLFRLSNTLRQPVRRRRSGDEWDSRGKITFWRIFLDPENRLRYPPVSLFFMMCSCSQTRRVVEENLFHIQFVYVKVGYWAQNSHG